MWSRFVCGAVEVWWWLRLRYARGAVEVRFRYAHRHGAVLTFYRAVLYIDMSLNNIGYNTSSTVHVTVHVCMYVYTNVCTQHTLGGHGAVNGVSVDELRLGGAAAVGLEDVDRVDRVPHLTPGIRPLHSLGCLNDHVGEEVSLTV